MGVPVEVPVNEEVPVPVPVGVEEGVPVPDGVVVGVSDAEAPGLRLAVALALTVLVGV